MKKNLKIPTETDIGLDMKTQLVDIISAEDRHEFEAWLNCFMDGLSDEAIDELARLYAFKTFKGSPHEL